MTHVLEPATTGRSRCRGCTRPIGRGELRFGERIANPYGEGETTLWFHPLCAAYKRPGSLLEFLAQPGDVPDRDSLERAAHAASAAPRLPRIDGAERAPGGQAKCRHCREPIPRGSWRIRLTYFEEVRFTPGGFIHLDCRSAYFETSDTREAVLHFSPDLDPAQRDELTALLAAPPAPPG
ncbi:MAG: hypothetical protein KBD01_02855 [Acidobacteria bacterium]|nr:hypothetical protein [Acidobacteriota bacterium]